MEVREFVLVLDRAHCDTYVHMHICTYVFLAHTFNTQTYTHTNTHTHTCIHTFSLYLSHFRKVSACQKQLEEHMFILHKVQ